MLDHLTRITDGSTRRCSSWDTTGGNADRWIIPAGETAVLADIKGPGSISRIWSANPSGQLRIYFDDEPTPRVDCDFQAFFKDQVPPFAGPLTSTSSGGWYSYTPMPFAKRCLVTSEGKQGYYYQVSYQKYPAGTKVATFDPKLNARTRTMLDTVQKRWSDPAAGPARPAKGSLVATAIGADALGHVTIQVTANQEAVVAPGKRAVIWDHRGAGCIRALRMRVTGADPQVLRRTSVSPVGMKSTGPEMIPLPSASIFRM